MELLPPGFQVLIFDLDDTLYKEIDFVMSAYKHIDRLLVADYDMKPNEAYKILVNAFNCGENAFDVLQAYLTKKGINIPDAIAWMVEEYRNHIPMISLNKETRQMLEHMQAMGVPMFIITDGRSFTQRNKIRALGLYDFIPWNNIFISEEMGCEKTNPAAFEEIKRRYPSYPGEKVEYLFVGDNPAKDFIVANTHGGLSVLLLDNGKNIHPQDIKVDNKHQARYCIKRFKELDDYINDSFYF